MDSDRELLKLAAKAAGLKIKWDARGPYIAMPGFSGNSDTWDPLTDDGDALRLAVKLRLRIEHGPGPAVYAGTGSDDEAENLACEVWHKSGPHIEDATRRAIVRAAAELGRRG